jgi:integrase
MSDTGLRSLPTPAKGQATYWDASLPAFGLRVSQGGSKTFVLKRDNTLLTLGRFGVLKLSEARLEAKRLMAERTLGRVRPQSMSFQAALEAFRADKTRTRRTNTAANHRDRLMRHCRFTCQLGEVTHADILRSLAKIPTSPEHDHALSCIRTLFTWAHNRRYITDNPTVGIQPHGSQSRSRILTDDELPRVFASADDLGQFETVVKLLVLTGLRRGESAAISRSWIHEKEKMLVVPSTIAKTGEERAIPLGELSYSMIACAIANSPHDLLFPARGNETSPLNGWSKSSSALWQLAQVEGATLHDLRRTYRSNLGRLSVAPHIAERLVGHVSSQSQMSRIYDRHTYWPELYAAVQRYDDWFRTTILIAGT